MQARQARPSSSKELSSAPRPTSAQAVEDLRKQQPGGSINHTDYNPLREMPVAVCIECKAPGEQLSVAEVQVAVWQAAQWRMLEEIVLVGDEAEQASDEDVAGKEAEPAMNLVNQAEGGEPPMESRMSISGNDNDDGPEADKRATTRSAAQQMIPFLPALIVQGHEWYLAFTSFEDGMTTLWMRYNIGSTDQILGIFKLVRILQVLRDWVADTYWPWFKEHVLRIVA